MSTDAPFINRRDAGRRLAAAIPGFIGDLNPMILALPRGGVPVAAEVARALGLPFDVLIVRKLGVPGHEEYAMGAIAGGGVKVLDQQVVSQLRLSEAQVAAVVEKEGRELARREAFYRAGRPEPAVTGRNVVLVDDGIATGSTIRAAISLLRRQGAGRIVVAAPVAPRDAVERLREMADEVIVASIPHSFGAVGLWYEDFSATSDEEVKALLEDQETSGAR